MSVNSSHDRILLGCSFKNHPFASSLSEKGNNRILNSPSGSPPFDIVLTIASKSCIWLMAFSDDVPRKIGKMLNCCGLISKSTSLTGSTKHDAVLTMEGLENSRIGLSAISLTGDLIGLGE
ncbi:hypothetical protein RchiOBHm_Chr5g0080621 [Rosa chinensis]|uniref:Uncharacterized protein n=1 Tax=Rosa chinensis TaxID=74649 RepID=A0A2P6QMT5_ROSCH|nr:hypothetical protein RchiOBHm_Chr5g0080621 [Rosa chinensis]